MEKNHKLSIVGYHNTLPFLKGIERDEIFDVILDIPSRCIGYFISNQVDISLVPVASLQDIPDDQYQVITDYCIGTKGEVRTVALFSNSPISKLGKVYLDADSRTSAELVKILMREHWNQKIDYRSLNDMKGSLSSDEGIMLIGDKVFAAESKYKFKEDLGKAWYDFTGLPFVFAVWIARNNVDPLVIGRLNRMLAEGVDMISDSDNWDVKIAGVDFKQYFERYIDYHFDDDKRKAMQFFLRLISSS